MNQSSQSDRLPGEHARHSGPNAGTASRLAFVDTMRFLAASFVMLQHFLEKQADAASHAIVSLGPGVAGVALFFFVSGYIIPFSVSRGFNALDFAVRRVFRIYPLYLAVLILYGLAMTLGIAPGYARPLSAWDWITSIFLISDYVGARQVLGVAWTLSLEFAWYFLFAAFVLMFGQRIARRLEFVMVAVVIAAFLISLASGVRVPFGRIFMLYAAVIGYRAFLLNDGQINGKSFAVSIALFFGLLCPSFILSFGVYSHPNMTLAQTINPWTLSTTIFVCAIAIPRLRTSWILTNPVTTYLGKISYSIYLLHSLCWQMAFTLLGPEMTGLAAALLTIGLSAVTYGLVERSGIRLGRKLARATPWTRRKAIISHA